ncbi:hypothetical protein [Paramesorhizobium deserti]|uniref:hypothetical protein n=1 Tax=Paramesorhizobium deserti TaxID=1494590 RepID=UPI0012905479|nr:hypothetical protein [Paramesorhizobium deserti]
MKKYLSVAGISAIVLSSMIGFAISQEPAKNPLKPGEKDYSSFCQNKAFGTAFDGYVRSVLPAFNGANQVSVLITPDSNKSSIVQEYTSLALDTSGGSALYTGLLSMLVSGMHGTFYCDGNGKVLTIIVGS